MQFVATLETNIFAKINALVNVTITKVVMGSISVTNSVAFTGADSAAALAGQSALAQVLSSTDASSLFGTTFGSVTVSNVAQTNATNPSRSPVQSCILPEACVFACGNLVVSSVVSKVQSC